MKRNTKVSWTLKDGIAGSGITIADADESGKILVAVDPVEGTEFHNVIYCAVTWLTEVPAQA